MFQTSLSVEAGGEAVFLPVADVLTDDRWEPDAELRRLNLQYRNRLEFAVGRTCSADWKVADGARAATRVCTTWLPVSETPQTAAREIDGALLDMTRLSEASEAELESGLRPILSEYAAWLDAQAAAASTLPEHLRGDAEEAITDARLVSKQLAEGLDLLLSDPEALRCFRFMNQVMADQRIHTQVAERRSKDPNLSRAAAREQVLADGPRAHSWRPFQLAFVLMQIPSLIKPELPRRSGNLAKVELLFFPTGGGKTEAYLGLAAFAFAARRRQGVVVRCRRTHRRALRGGRADAIHPAAAHLPAVPAGHRDGVCRRAAPPSRRGDLGQRAVPDRPVGRHRGVAQAVRGGRRAAEERQ